MFIGVAALLFASLLGLSKCLIDLSYLEWAGLLKFLEVIRYLLIKENKDFARKELADLNEAQRNRIEEAARLVGITFEQAMENKKGFRYLYWNSHVYGCVSASFPSVSCVRNFKVCPLSIEKTTYWNGSDILSGPTSVSKLINCENLRVSVV